MKSRRLFVLFFLILALAQTAYAQTRDPFAVVLTLDNIIMPSMYDYIQRGIDTANQRNAEVIIIELNTPGGRVDTTLDIVGAIRNSDVPVVVYVTPKNAMAGSGGAIISMAGHVIAMSPETSIGAASPITSDGENLTSTADKKAKEIIKASIRPFTIPRGDKAAKLAEAMIDDAVAVTADEALQVGLIDFIADDTEDLLQAIHGMDVETNDGTHTLNTDGIDTQSIDISFIEQILLILADSNVAFLLLALGAQALYIEISSPGGWAAGFLGVVCLTLAGYGLGVLSVNWFGLIFLITSFVLFILDIKAPTHGALTAAGVASFIVGALVLFNSPGTPDFQRVSIPLVVGTGLFIGSVIFAVLIVVLRVRKNPIQIGSESLAGKTGTAQTFEGDAGQVHVNGEMWSAEKSTDSEPIGKGDKIEVVEIRGLRLIVKKK
ncbi:MAG: nodulation protein NfeD [Anaerolineales bacterium]|nr:nodulation protein NfeD [Anaerolineales bacterium]MCB9144484.1 nodulation protein NfeD [Anaerolineales bacterium]